MEQYWIGCLFRLKSLPGMLALRFALALSLSTHTMENQCMEGYSVAEGLVPATHYNRAALSTSTYDLKPVKT